jgi:hypothetical protein
MTTMSRIIRSRISRIRLGRMSLRRDKGGMPEVKSQWSGLTAWGCGRADFGLINGYASGRVHKRRLPSRGAA